MGNESWIATTIAKLIGKKAKLRNMVERESESDSNPRVSTGLAIDEILDSLPSATETEDLARLISNAHSELQDDLKGLNENSRLEDKREILKPSYLRLLQQILASESGALCARELDYRNSDLKDSTIRDHLRAMEAREQPFVVKLSVDEEKREQHLPWTFYAVSEYGIELLKEVGAYEGISLLYQMYSRLDTSEISEIEKFEHRPEPDWL